MLVEYIGIYQNIDYYVTISFTTLYSGYHTSIQEKITAAQEAVPADRLRVYLTWLFWFFYDTTIYISKSMW